MSQKPSLEVREQVATRIAERFNRLPPDEKRRFVDDTLTTLVNMSRNEMKKLFSKMFWKKGRPSEKDLEMMNQLIVVFIYSVRPEFQFHYASMIHKALKLPQPSDIVEKLQKVRQLVFLGDMGVTPKVYSELYERWTKTGQPPYDEFFTTLLNADKK